MIKERQLEYHVHWDGKDGLCSAFVIEYFDGDLTLEEVIRQVTESVKHAERNAGKGKEKANE